MAEEKPTVRVLVGQPTGEGFGGYWAKFEGQEVASHEAEEHLVYKLYKCTEYNFDAYRVHILDERNQLAPVYELRPPSQTSSRHPRHGVYDLEELAKEYPIFLRRLGTSNLLNEKWVEPG